MKTHDPQIALREWRMHLRHKTTLLALGAAGAVLGIAGPFGTEALMPMVPRLAYWIMTVFATYGAASLLAMLTGLALAQSRQALKIGASGLAAGVGACLVVVLINLLSFGWMPKAQDWPGFLGTILAISMIVTISLALVQDKSDEDTQGPPPILDRLPFDKRGALVALSVEDHYVRIRTLNGEEMVFMRLADAMREVGDTPGAQVHRSHWVSWEQVTSVTRQGDRAVLTMKQGPNIPVSRANIPKLREAGLL